MEDQRRAARPGRDPIDRDDDPDAEDRLASGDDRSERPAALSELLRRAVAMGFSGFFTTEEAIRRALGDTVPKDWVDFAADQSERTRAELLDRLAREFGRVLEGVDVAELARAVLAGRALQIDATIRLVEPDDENTRGGVRLSLRDDPKERE